MICYGKYVYGSSYDLDNVYHSPYNHARHSLVTGYRMKFSLYDSIIRLL